jgi:glycosyltransferase involved in cell wall biosynthesis
MTVDEAAHTGPRRRQLVSVIMPVYNAAATLDQQLNALKTQVFDGPWEIVAVDNHSTDDSATVIRQYQQQMPHLRLVQAEEQQSAAYTRNVGARVAKGDVFLFCDADDVVAPGWLAALAQALEQHDFVASTMEVEALNKDKAWRSNYGNWATRKNLSFLPFAAGALMALSREAFERVGGFNEKTRIGEDIEISWRLQLQGYSLHPVPDAVIHYRYRETLQATWKQNVCYGEAHAYLYKQFASCGMPGSSVRTIYYSYRGLLTGLPHVLWGDENQKAEVLRVAALCYGRLRGSLRYRTLYL